jgi:hypothetical protein
MVIDFAITRLGLSGYRSSKGKGLLVLHNGSSPSHILEKTEPSLIIIPETPGWLLLLPFTVCYSIIVLPVELYSL